MKRLLLSLFILGTFCAHLSSQIVIRGKVLLHDTPVENVSIFLNNTTIGTTTDKDGMFSLNIAKGSYQLIVSHLGFATIEHYLDTDTYSTPLHFSLKEEDVLLDEVVVKAPQNKDEWKYNFELFRREFIGASSLAQFCKIENPEVLHLNFNRQKNILTAYTDKPLLIKNEALGYEISYRLVKFSTQNNYTSYLGYAQFKELKGRKRKQKRWKKNRLKAYKGSQMHFFRSVLKNTTKKEGFIINQFKRKKNENRPSEEEIDKAREIVAASDKLVHFSMNKKNLATQLDSAMLVLERVKLPKLIDYLYRSDIPSSDIIKKTNEHTYLQFENNLIVVYTKEKEEKGYILRGVFSKPRKALPQTSNIIPLVRPSIINPNGTLREPLDLLNEGYWSYEKFAHALPLNYNPANE